MAPPLVEKQREVKVQYKNRQPPIGRRGNVAMPLVESQMEAEIQQATPGDNSSGRFSLLHETMLMQIRNGVKLRQGNMKVKGKKDWEL